MFENFSIGTDIETISRFKSKTPEKSKKFLERVFTQHELEYCFSKKNYTHSLCARFCAKEAIIKALFGLNVGNLSYKDIEILNTANGVPYAEIKKYPDVKIKLSLSHCKTYAIATALLYKSS